jgi:predicted ATPase
LNLFVGFNGGASALLHTSAGPARIRLKLDAPPNSYEAVLGAAANDELIFTDEMITYHGPGYTQPWQGVIGRGHRETRLHEVVEQRGQPSVASHIVDLLRGCRVFHFHDTSADAPVKQTVSTADNLTLRQDAGNLAAILLSLK